jgi:hypothetical protein
MRHVQGIVEALKRELAEMSCADLDAYTATAVESDRAMGALAGDVFELANLPAAYDAANEDPERFDGMS